MNSQDDLYRIDNFVRFRNPFYAQIGYHCDDSHGCGPCRFKWFDSLSEMIDHILNVELPLLSCDREMLDELRPLLEQLLGRVTAEGLTEELRESLNQQNSGFALYWWGALDDLLSGETQFSREILDGFTRSQSSEATGRTLMVDFVEFLRQCCGSDSDADSGVRVDEHCAAGQCH